jgi:hypothetical protein
MATKKAATAAKEPSNDYDILFPQGVDVDVSGDKITIYPLPDAAYQRIASAIIRTSSLFMNITNALSGAGEGDVASRLASLAEVMESAFTALVPDATSICAAALKKDEAFVQANYRLLGRTQILRAVLEAEDVPGLLGEFKALSQMFSTVAEQTTASESPQETSTT